LKSNLKFNSKFPRLAKVIFGAVEPDQEIKIAGMFRIQSLNLKITSNMAQIESYYARFCPY